MQDSFSLNDCAHIDRVFAARGDVLKRSPGQTVERLEIDGAAYMLKRFWWQPLCFWRRVPRNGLRELRMTQWLHKHGFHGPQVIARGRHRRGGITTRVYHLSREIPNECTLAECKARYAAVLDDLLCAAISHLARLHDRGFAHGALSASNIHVARQGRQWTFRHHELEHARVEEGKPLHALPDLQSLLDSIEDDELRWRVREHIVLTYPAARAGVRNPEKLRLSLNDRLKA